MRAFVVQSLESRVWGYPKKNRAQQKLLEKPHTLTSSKGLGPKVWGSGPRSVSADLIITEAAGGSTKKGLRVEG